MKNFVAIFTVLSAICLISITTSPVPQVQDVGKFDPQKGQIIISGSMDGDQSGVGNSLVKAEYNQVWPMGNNINMETNVHAQKGFGKYADSTFGGEVKLLIPVN